MSAQRVFVPPPPFPPAYGGAAAIALGLGLFGGFLTGLYALGAPAFGWPATAYLALVQAHGQIQILGFAGLLIVGVGGLLLPGFWRAKLANPGALSAAGWLVGQPWEAGPLRTGLLALAAVLPPLGFAWAGRQMFGARPQNAGKPAAWELLLLVGAISLISALVLRAISLLVLAQNGLPADFGLAHQLLVPLELDGFLLAATIGVQLRLLPHLARTRPDTGMVQTIGIGALVLGLLVRAIGVGLAQLEAVTVGLWLTAGGALALFWATGLGRPGIPPTVQAPATLLPGRTRIVLRVAWVGLLVGLFGRASGLLPPDAANHAFTTVYLVPLILVVGIRMLPRVSAYPIRYPAWCGALVWAGLVGGVLRSVSAVIGGALGAQIGWLGGSVLTVAVLIFMALAWSPWGVPTGVPRPPEIIQIERKPPPSRPSLT
jgi:hypothetical protein